MTKRLASPREHEGVDSTTARIPVNCTGSQCRADGMGRGQRRPRSSPFEEGSGLFAVSAPQGATCPPLLLPSDQSESRNRRLPALHYSWQRKLRLAEEQTCGNRKAQRRHRLEGAPHALHDRQDRRVYRRAAPGTIRYRRGARRPSWPSRPWSSGTDRWSCASLPGACWPIQHDGGKTPSRRLSWS